MRLRLRRSSAGQAQQFAGEVSELRQIIAGLSAKLQHLEEKVTPATDEVATLQLRRFLAITHKVAHLQINVGVAAAEAIAATFQTVTKPLPPGVAGGLARVETAARNEDGTFMSYDDEQQIRLAQYDRMARGGRARAFGALRTANGRFLPGRKSQCRLCKNPMLPDPTAHEILDHQNHG